MLYYNSEPAPMGIADFGVGPSGGYQYASNSTLGVAEIGSLSTLCVPASSCYGAANSMTIQLNANLRFNESKRMFVYWIQDVAFVDTSTHEIYFVDNIWNFSSYTAAMSGSGISGQGRVSSCGSGCDYYYVVASASLPGNHVDLTYPSTVQLLVSSSTSVSDKPVVSFQYDDGYGWQTYDTVTFVKATALTSLSGFVVDGLKYNPYGIFYDSELILGGPGGGSQTNDTSSNVKLQLEHLSGDSYQQVTTNAYNFGADTAEGINMTLSQGFYYENNGLLVSLIQHGSGTLGQLFQHVPSFELTALLGVYDSRPDLQSAFPEATTGAYANLVNWAYGVVTQQWVDSNYDSLAPYGYWYALMYTYNVSPDLQAAFPNAYYSNSSYQELINWAGGVVTQQWVDGRYSQLSTYGYWYDLMMTYDQRSDLQGAFPNVYSNSITSDYKSLINWAGGVVTQQVTDGSYAALEPYGYWYTLMDAYNTGSDLQAAFPSVYASQSQFQNLINWAGGVVTGQWVDGRSSTLSVYGYWYDLMMVYNRNPDLQTAFPSSYSSQSQYHSLINWAGGVVTQQWTDGRITLLNPFGYWYDLMMTYNQRSDLQTAFPNAYTSATQYQNLINWANNVVTGVIKPQDGSYTNLNYYASYYETHAT